MKKRTSKRVGRPPTPKPLSYRTASKVGSTAKDAIQGVGLLFKFFAHSAKTAGGGVRSTATNVRTGLKDGWKAD